MKSTLKFIVKSIGNEDNWNVLDDESKERALLTIMPDAESQGVTVSMVDQYVAGVYEDRTEDVAADHETVDLESVKALLDLAFNGNDTAIVYSHSGKRRLSSLIGNVCVSAVIVDHDGDKFVVDNIGIFSASKEAHAQHEMHRIDVEMKPVFFKDFLPIAPAESDEDIETEE